MKVVSVINYKGGVGKTTLTANLGAYAASQGKRVLMIDMDPQTQLTFSFMTHEYWREKYADTRTLKNYFEPIIKSLDDLIPLSELVIHLNPGNMLKFNNETLDIISSHLSLIDIDIKLAALINISNKDAYTGSFLKTHSYLRRSLSEIKDSYDIVIIDCPPTFNAIVKNALLASDYYIVPARLDYLSFLGVNELNHNVKLLLDEYHEHQQSMHSSKYLPVFLTMMGVVPMMTEMRKGDEPIETQKEYRRELESKVYHIFKFIRNNGKVFGSSPREGIPVVLTRPKFNITARKIVNELKELGSEFLEKLKTPE